MDKVLVLPAQTIPEKQVTPRTFFVDLAQGNVTIGLEDHSALEFVTSASGLDQLKALVFGLVASNDIRSTAEPITIKDAPIAPVQAAVAPAV